MFAKEHICQRERGKIVFKLAKILQSAFHFVRHSVFILKLIFPSISSIAYRSLLIPQKSIWPFTISFETFTLKFVFMLTSLFVKLAINSVSVLVSSGSPLSLKRAK